MPRHLFEYRTDPRFRNSYPCSIIEARSILHYVLEANPNLKAFYERRKAANAAAVIADRKAMQDIHRSNAAITFGVTPENVTHEMRTFVKAQLFGKIYGMRDFGKIYAMGTLYKLPGLEGSAAQCTKSKESPSGRTARTRKTSRSSSPRKRKTKSV